MNKVLVDRGLLERIAHDDEGLANLADFEELKRILAQQAEPAPAQEEREAFEVEIPDISAIYDGRSLIPYRSLEAGERLMTVAQHLRIENQLRAALTRPAQTEQPDRYTIGDLTYEKVFKAAGLTNLSDLQAVLDAVEAAIAQDSMSPEHRGCLRAATPAMDDQQ